MLAGILVPRLARDPRVADRAHWQQVTDFADSVTSPALSLDGRMVAFLRGPDTFTTEGEIYVKVLPDGEPLQLTRDGLVKMSPVFTPDGGRVVYTAAPWDTWIVPIDGRRAAALAAQRLRPDLD